MDMYISSMESLVDLTSRTDPFCHFGGNKTSPFWRFFPLDELATLSSHNHGSVENHPKWKETTIGDTPIFHWTMIMGGSGNWHWVSSSIVKSCERKRPTFGFWRAKKLGFPQTTGYVALLPGETGARPELGRQKPWLYIPFCTGWFIEIRC